ncbi:MAG: Dabb family protein [Actinomycetes bacterium]
MLRHVVTLTLVDNTPQATADVVVAEISALAQLVPSVQQLTVGVDVGVDANNAQIGIVADFADAGGYEEYRDHPDHRRVIVEHVRPVLASRSAVQFEFQP